MRMIAEKRVVECTERNIEVVKTVFLVETGETVEALLRRVGLTGAIDWHYNEAEVRIKIVKSPRGVTSDG